MDLAAFRALLTPAGQALLARAAELYDATGGDALRTVTLLRKQPGVDADVASAALTQVELRRRAVAKLGEDALRMYFTPDGLEQATRRRVAEHRAAPLPAPTRV